MWLLAVVGRGLIGRELAAVGSDWRMLYNHFAWTYPGGDIGS